MDMIERRQQELAEITFKGCSDDMIEVIYDAENMRWVSILVSTGVSMVLIRVSIRLSGSTQPKPSDYSTQRRFATQPKQPKSLLNLKVSSRPSRIKYPTAKDGSLILSRFPVPSLRSSATKWQVSRFHVFIEEFS